MRRPLARTALALTLSPMLLLSACGTGNDDDPTIGAPPQTQDGPSAAVRTLPPSQALTLIKQETPVVLDVRTPQEFAGGHLTAARNLALGEGFAGSVGALPRSETYVVYCASGNRSARAARIMAGLGFTDVVDAGGLNDLAAAGAQVVT